MPWEPKDARRFTKKAKSRAQREAWAETANAVLRTGQPEGVAVRTANATVRDMKRERG